MREYIDEAIILNKRESGHLDSRYSIFTRRFGKMVAKAKSARKTTSKLAGHLEPGSVADVRLIEMHGLQVVDALKNDSVFSGQAASLADLYLLDRLLAEAEPEPFIWALARRGQFLWPEILRTLGWDPAEAVCSVCGVSPVAGFWMPRQDFFCKKCSMRLPKDEMVSLE
jgi:DNA repair protein RecO (recombination protein O)